MIRFHFVIGLIISTLFGCGAPDPQAKLQWGALPEGDSIGYGKWLVDLMPSDSIRVCADTDDLAERGVQIVKLWAAPIGRAEKLDVKAGCSGGVRLLKIHDGSAGPCGAGAAGCSGGNEIWIGNARSKLGTYVMIHEIGHQWGMCDQYAGVENCEVSGPNGKNNRSVMGNGNPNQTNISADDIEGIRYLADMYPQRPRKTKANDAWKQLINSASNAESSEGNASSADVPPNNPGASDLLSPNSSETSNGSSDGFSLMMKILALILGS